MRNSTLLAAGLSSLALLALSSPASACWDGYSAQVGNVMIMQAGPDAFDPATARDIAAWAPRIDAVLGADTTLTSEHGFVDVVAPGHEEQGRWEDGKMESLYRLAVRLSHRTAPRDAGLAARPYTVQVFAARSYDNASAFAASLDAALDARTESTDIVGFYEAGGYPARHPLTHVITEKDADGRPIHRVVVGAFLREAEARDAFASLHREKNVGGFVRPL